MNDQYEFGMIGLGTMGSNLVLNMSDKGFSVAGYDKDRSQVDNLNKLAADRKIKAYDTIENFVSALARPRVIMLLVPAGPIVDAVVFELKPLLSEHDLIIDCGNSHFADTQKRTDLLLQEGLHFMGMGVSGGEAGARFGPSLMPGGDIKAYERISPMLQAVAAKVNGEPCVAYMGKGAAGHYVKMVHNGIEYAIMQLIAETYHLLKKCAGLSDAELSDVYQKWNGGKLHSFLVEVTAAIFKQPNEENTGMIINNILDTAHQKGTGAWMSIDAMKNQCPVPTIDAAVSQRALSAMNGERVAAYKLLATKELVFGGDKQAFINGLEDALFFASAIAYAQGFALLHQASLIYKYNTNVETVATVWRGGCIIRAAILEDIRVVFKANPDLENLLVSDHFSALLAGLRQAPADAVTTGLQQHIPLPALGASVNYYDSYHSSWLPANLIQAQRDFFGAHTYERVDKPGIFHTIWNQIIQ
jgi:6-phosphogluconate dehydrogenase